MKLENFIIKAKSSCYVGDGVVAASCRTDSHDLEFTGGKLKYLDSYFGGTNFLGQEVVWRNDKAVWALNYYGYIVEPKLINSEQAGDIIKQSLSLLYKENRFLGGFEHNVGEYIYRDTNSGDVNRFMGTELILLNGQRVYQLDYHGGEIIT